MTATSNASLSSLLGKTSLNDHEQRLQASEAALKKSSTDLQAQHVKVVALLKLDRYDDAVSFFESAGKDLKSKAGLEYAYALYKAGRLEEAAQTASKLTGQRGGQHVEAQARYRLEDFSRTAQLYKDIRQKSVSSEEFDLKVNQGAIDAQGQWLGFLDPSTARRPDREDLAAFETAYNAACGSIARGELSQADVLLKRAKTLCQHSEELTDEQKTEELLPIVVQQVYVLYRQGKPEEAEALAREVEIENVADPSTKKIASTNLLLGPEYSSNPFLAHKTFNSTPPIPESDKLFSYQSIPLSSDEKTIDINSLKFEGLIKSTKAALAKLIAPTSSSEALLLSSFHAAAIGRNGTDQVAINKMLAEFQKRPSDIALAMTLVQSFTRIGNTTSAVKIVESLTKHLQNSTTDSALRYHPSLVSMITALYRHQGRNSDVKQELTDAACFWKQQPHAPVTLLRAAGVSLLESSTEADSKAASEIFDKLYQEQAEDKAIVAGFVASHALSEPETVKRLAEKLSPLSSLIAGIDVVALESNGIPQASNALAIAQAGVSRKRAVSSGAEVGRKKRVRKSRLPKGYDPSSEAKPDPERWLPMRDRSYYRPPKGRKKAKRGDDRTQGGVLNEDLDVSKQPQKGAEIVGSGGGSGGSGAKKKKGKGKK